MSFNSYPCCDSKSSLKLRTVRTEKLSEWITVRSPAILPSSKIIKTLAIHMTLPSIQGFSPDRG